MNLQEYKAIRHLSYDEVMNYFINKNGQPKVSYGKNGYNKKGYECHHIREDQESDLSDAKKIRDFPEFQQPECLVYLKYDEHLLAHLLISAEVLLKDTNSERCEDLSKGGIGLILGNHINSVNKEVLANMLADYCNKISTQMVLDVNNSREALEFVKKNYGLTDERVVKKVESLLKDPICLDHNRQAYVETEAMLLKNNSAISCICTCGGKTPFALEYMREHIEQGKKFLVITPNKQIYEQWTKDSSSSDIYEVYTIQTFYKEHKYTEELDSNKYCGIIVDEVHHIHSEAEKWTKCAHYALEKGLKILGLTATVSESQISENDPLFGGRIVYGLDIAEGIKNGTLWPYNYISTIYTNEGLSNSEYNMIQDKLDMFLSKHNIAEIIKSTENELKRAYQKKGIIFVTGTRNIPDSEKENKLAVFEKTIAQVKDAYPNATFYIISSHQDKNTNAENKVAFINEKEKDVFLVSYGMVNEGAHYEGINTLIMFRTTRSSILFNQQLGRIMRLKCKCPEDPHLVVFDFSNNIFTLLDEDEDEEYTKPENTGKKRNPKPMTYLPGQDVICRCECQDIVDLLMQLKLNREAGREDRLLSRVFEELNIDLNDETLSDFFEDETEEWKDVEILTKNNVNITKSPVKVVRDSINENTEQTFKSNDTQVTIKTGKNNSNNGNTKVKMNKAQLLTYLVKLVTDRAFICEALTTDLEITDDVLLSKLCKEVKLKRSGYDKLLGSEYKNCLKGRLILLNNDLHLY